MDNPESKKEQFSEDVDLRIQDPYMDKHFMIGFDGQTERECEIYNGAIQYVLEKANLNPFHQVGVRPDGQNEPGYHAWEMWRDADRKPLEKLLSEIKEKAEELKKK